MNVLIFPTPLLPFPILHPFSLLLYLSHASQVLFLLVGYDELTEEESGDITELIDGQMLPNATVVLTSRPGSAKPMPALLHRRLLIAGLAPDQTHSFITKYFQAINKPGSTSEVGVLCFALSSGFTCIQLD